MKMVLQCAICDDDVQAVKLAKQKAKKVFDEKKIQFEIYSYCKPKEFLFNFDGSNRLDLLILDIEMPNITGLEIAKQIKKLYKNCLIVFLTSYLNYAIDGYELEIFRFVPKAEIETRLPNTIADAIKVIDFESHKNYYIEKRDFCQSVAYKDILYIKKESKNSELTLINGECISVRKPLSTVFEELDSEDFIYIDRGCIANMANVKKLDRCWWVCKNGEKLQISHCSYSKISKSLMEFWGRKILDD